MAAIGGIEFANQQQFVSSSATDLLTNILVLLAGVSGVAALGEVDERNKALGDVAKYRQRAEQLENIVRGLSTAKKLPKEYAEAWDRIHSAMQIGRS